MIDSYKTKTQLIDELGKLRRQIAELDKTKIKLKKIDEALWESEEIFYKIFSSALDGIIITNSEGRVAFWNRAAEKMFGYSTEEALGKLIHKLIIPQKNWTKFESELPNFKKTGKGSTIDKVTEGVLLRKNGEKLTAEISLSSIQLWKKWYAIAIVHDITERKRAEEKLQESEKKYRAIFENTGTATFIIEEDTTISLANNKFTKLSGYSRGEIEGKKSWTEFVVKEDLDRMRKYHYARRKAPDKAPKNYEFRFIDRNGSVKNIFITVDMIPGTKKSVASYLDITELKKAEEKIKASLKEREAMLREIHHRVKNNMQVISSLLRLPLRQIKNKKILDVFNVAQNRIRSMALIHDSLYRSEDLAMINFSDYINKLTTHLLAMYRTGSGNIDLRTEVEDVFLDINRAIPCGLIINELVSNSLKHAFTEGVKGEITVKMYSDKKGKYILIVSDTGIGLPEKIDFREVKTLGLQMVKDLVNQLNGTISLYRKMGTTFKITF